MNEQEAKAWLDTHFDVSRETWDRLEHYIALLLVEADQQNLIARSTFEMIWSRHIVDCAQLLTICPELDRATAHWVDLGTGAGLPAIILAILGRGHVTMIESRRGRIEFLTHVAEKLGLDNVSILHQKVEKASLPRPATAITARAYAPLDRLFDSAIHMAEKETVWVLPKGRSWQNELDMSCRLWQGMFHVERSVTDAESAIIIARDVRKAAKGKAR